MSSGCYHWTAELNTLTAVAGACVLPTAGRADPRTASARGAAIAAQVGEAGEEARLPAARGGVISGIAEGGPPLEWTAVDRPAGAIGGWVVVGLKAVG